MAGDLAGMRIVMTGATGFIGRAVLAETLARGAQVAATARSRDAARRVQAMGAEPLQLPLCDVRALGKAMRGADYVISLAYDVRAAPAENVACFRSVLEAADTACVGGIIHASSAVVYETWPAGPVADGDPVCGPDAPGYRGAKAMMEADLAKSGLAATVLRPTLVYGAGSRYWTTRFLTALAQGGLVLPQEAGIFHGLHIDDLARAVVGALGAGPGGAGAYLVSGPPGQRWDSYIGALAGLAGDGNVLRLPADQLRARLGPRQPAHGHPGMGARLSAALRRLLGNERFERQVARVSTSRNSDAPLYPDHTLLDIYLARGNCDCGAAARAFGFQPEIDTDKGCALIGQNLARRA